MSKKKLILLPSKLMDKNKKSDRNENGLVRMPAKTRKFMGFPDDQVEIWTTEERQKSAVLLDIFHAYREDVSELKKLIREGKLKSSDTNRVAWVTTKMYNRVTGGDDDKNIWISVGVDDIVQGADPEFLLFNADGSIRPANSVSGMSKSSKIGSDGAMAELRPDPATNPEMLVNNIKRLLSDEHLTSNIENFSWHAGCYYSNSSRDFPIGGHIHIGNPVKVVRIPMARRMIFFNVANKIIDELLAIPCIRLDGELGTNRRAKCKMAQGACGFGFFGEWRECNGRLEHRTLSGMWLSHPELAKAVLGTAKCITDEIFKRWASRNFENSYIAPEKYFSYKKQQFYSSDFDGWKELQICKDFRAVRSSGEMRKILDDSKAGDITKSLIDSWYSNIRSLSTFEKYGDCVRSLREILKRPMNELKNINTNLRQNWVEGRKFLTEV